VERCQTSFVQRAFQALGPRMRAFDVETFRAQELGQQSAKLHVIVD